MPILLRATAAIGLLLSLWSAALDGGALGDQAVFGVGLAVLAGSAVTILYSGEGKTIRSSWWQTLVPFLCLSLAQVLIVVMMASAALQSVLSDGPRLQLGQIGTVISVGLLAIILTSMAASIWMAGVVAEVASDPSGETQLRDAIVPGWHRALHHWKAGALAALTGWAGTITILLVIGGLVGLNALPLTLPLLVVWNVWTAGLLPWALTDEHPPVASVRRGLQQGNRWKEWVGPVIVHLALFGLFAFASGVSQNAEGYKTFASRWNVSANWMGGFPIESQWVRLMQTVTENPNESLWTFLVGAVLFLTSVAVRLRVARALLSRRDEHPIRAGE